MRRQWKRLGAGALDRLACTDSPPRYDRDLPSSKCSYGSHTPRPRHIKSMGTNLLGFGISPRACYPLSVTAVVELDCPPEAAFGFIDACVVAN